MEEWRSYRSHKVIQAAPIVEIAEHGGTLSILVKPYGDHTIERFVPTEPGMIPRAEVGGYALKYPDGFKSVSPKLAFEVGYRPVPEPMADGHAAYLRLLDGLDAKQFRILDLDAFAAGIAAHQAGIEFHANPHGDGEIMTAPRLSWWIGWNERALKAGDGFR